jgi:hypothetical protein
LYRKLRGFEFDLKSLIYGEVGEKRVSKTLKALEFGGNIKVINNLELELEKVHCEIDNLVITEDAIFVVEVKNYHKDKIIREDGIIVGKNKKGIFEYYDLGSRMNAKESIVSKTIHDSLLKKGLYLNIPIYKVVVSANTNSVLKNEYENVRVCSVASIADYIKSVKNTRVRLNRRQIELVYNSLLAAEVCSDSRKWAFSEELCAEVMDFVSALQDKNSRKEYSKKKILPKWLYKLSKFFKKNLVRGVA